MVHPVHSRRTLVRLNLSYACHTAPSKCQTTCPADFDLPTRLLPQGHRVPWLIKYTNLTMTRPLRSTPITGASPLLRAGPPARPASVLRASGFRRRQPPYRPPAPSRTRARSISTRLPTFCAGAADRAHAASMPDTAWPVNGTPARLIPGPNLRPGFDAKYCFDTSTAVRSRSSSRSPPDA